jgi:hypothetical protein
MSLRKDLVSLALSGQSVISMPDMDGMHREG